MEDKPLIKNTTKLFLWILMLILVWIPINSVSVLLYYSIRLTGFAISLILFIEAYNPKPENRNAFIWRIRVLLWGNPNDAN